MIDVVGISGSLAMQETDIAAVSVSVIGPNFEVAREIEKVIIVNTQSARPRRPGASRLPTHAAVGVDAPFRVDDQDALELVDAVDKLTSMQDLSLMPMRGSAMM